MYTSDELKDLISKCEEVQNEASFILESAKYRASLYKHLLDLSELLKRLETL